MSVEPTADGTQMGGPWDHSQCPGFEGCPPRCPRFVDKEGVALLIQPYAEVPSQYESLVAFYEDYPREHRSMALPPIARQQIERWLDRLIERGNNIIAFDEGTVVGHVAYSPRDADESELVVFVDDEYQNRGLGTELCRQAIAYAAADGHDAMRLNVHVDNKRAISVYRYLGFEQVTREDDSIKMRLDIDATVAATVQAPPAERL